MRNVFGQFRFLNGAYEEEIQGANPGTACYLQPYDADRIVLLADSDPTPDSPITLYLSLTGSLNTVSYRAEIVGWQDKRKLDPDAFEAASSHIKKFQKNETEGIYLEF